MKKIGLTGGIATGKSTVTDWLMAELGTSLVLFDSDTCVKHLLNSSELISEIAEQFGSTVIDGGSVDKKALREIIFAHSDRREELEAILHPKVLKECLASAEEAEHRSGTKYFVADIPLLFEVDFEWPVESIWTVACRPQTQRLRLMRRSGLSSELATRIIEAQLPIDRKIAKSDLVLWNEGPMDCLYRQLDALTL